MTYPRFHHIHEPNSSIDIILHGRSKGIESPFIQKLITKSHQENNAVLALEFPFISEGTNPSPNLQKEQELLLKMLDYIKTYEYNTVRFITKSLGGVVASRFLNSLPVITHGNYSCMVFGYALPSINFNSFTGALTVVQGENDSHGGIHEVVENLEQSPVETLNIIGIKDASHSYNHDDLKENEAISRGYTQHGTTD